MELHRAATVLVATCSSFNKVAVEVARALSNKFMAAMRGASMLVLEESFS